METSISFGIEQKLQPYTILIYHQENELNYNNYQFFNRKT
ncbi:hypothetical protein A1OE_1304 [Candidatus Endolissoclinum faulkneri L2]|uniref:Uncharacterized protein n=1 Tax=Candidatus Endolissoclinum faulkneri L2 TaxID=1193729 RepID=K7YPP0_9PROT|nr:hypothetical protein A1OE_1304 [Candidatus Endolissoclinum faulkneri L2]